MNPDNELKQAITEPMLRKIKIIGDGEFTFYGTPDELINELVLVFQADRQRLLGEVLDKLPKKKIMPDTDKMMTEGYGLSEVEQEQVAVVEYNGAIDDVTAAITAAINGEK